MGDKWWLEQQERTRQIDTEAYRFFESPELAHIPKLDRWKPAYEKAVAKVDGVRTADANTDSVGATPQASAETQTSAVGPETRQALALVEEMKRKQAASGAVGPHTTRARELVEEMKRKQAFIQTQEAIQRVNSSGTTKSDMEALGEQVADEVERLLGIDKGTVEP